MFSNTSRIRFTKLNFRYLNRHAAGYHKREADSLNFHLDIVVERPDASDVHQLMKVIIDSFNLFHLANTDDRLPEMAEVPLEYTAIPYFIHVVLSALTGDTAAVYCPIRL